MNERIPLLAPRRLEDFSPEEYKTYIEGLFFKPEPKGKKPSRGWSFNVNKKGTLILRFTGREKFLTDAEIEEVSRETGKTQAEVFLKMKEKGIERKLV